MRLSHDDVFPALVFVLAVMSGCFDAPSPATSVAPQQASAPPGGAAHPLDSEAMPRKPLRPIREVTAAMHAAKAAASIAISRHQTAGAQAERTPNLTGRIWRKGDLERLTFSRSGCFGTCPVYDLHVYGDGRVIWEGEEFVEHPERTTSQLTAGEMKRVRRAFVDADLLAIKQGDIEDACKQRVTCGPTASFDVRLEGRSRQLEHYYGCSHPDAVADDDEYHCGRGPTFCRLAEVERIIKRIVGVHRWIGDGDPGPGSDPSYFE